jgi:antitoxin component YwqK of YwqJK toxin-antitoxin module
LTRLSLLLLSLLALALPLGVRAQVADPAATIFYQNDAMVRQELDTNEDGKPDVWIYFDATGKPSRQEADENFDGRVDDWYVYKDGHLVRQEVDADHDGQRDTIFDLDAAGKLAKKTTLARNGKPQRVVLFAGNVPAKQMEDTDGDGVLDRVIVFDVGKIVRVEDVGLREGKANTFSFYDKQGALDRVEGDRNKDGRVDTKKYYVNGKLDREELDSDFNGTFDTKTWHKDDQIVRREVDRDNDGKAEEVVEYANAQPVRQVKVTEKERETITFTDGKIARREIDSGKRGWPDLMEEYAGGRLVRKLEDTKHAGRYDTLTLWPDADTVIQEIDPDGDGKLDTRMTFVKGKLTRQDVDTNKDGKVDVWATYVNGEKVLQEEDSDFDGRIDARFSYAGGKVVKQEKVARQRPSPERAKPFAELPAPMPPRAAPASRVVPGREGRRT